MMIKTQITTSMVGLTKSLLSVLCFLFLCGCNSDTEVEFDVIGTGFKDAKLNELSIYCTGPGGPWAGDLEVTKRVVGRVKMKGTVNLPKNKTVQCSLSGEGLNSLPFIPIYNNSFKAREFKVIAPTRIQVRLHRKSIKFADESYDHVVFKKIDHITNKNVQIASASGISPR